MMKKTIICILLLLPVIVFAFDRGLEVTYPNIPGLTHPPTKITSPLPVFLRYSFELMIATSGFILFGTMVVAGVQMATSAGNPGQMSSAKDRLLKGFLGTLLIITSFIVLNSINPRIVSSDPALNANIGVTFFESSDEDCTVDWFDESRDERRSVSSNVADLEDELGFIPGSIKINGDPEDLDVLIFNKVDYEMKSGTPLIPVIETGKKCIPLSSFIDEAKSIKLQYRIAGAYMCSSAYSRIRGDYYCVDGEEQQTLRDIDILKSGFNDNLQGLRLVTGKGAAYPEINSEEGCSNKQAQCGREGGITRYNLWCYCKDSVATTKVPNPVSGLDECNALWSGRCAGEVYVDPDCRCETTYYGVILHDGANQGGEATPIYPNFDSPNAINTDLASLSGYPGSYNLTETSSVTLLTLSGQKFDDLTGGVTFHEEPDGLGDAYGSFPSRPEDCDTSSGGCIVKGTFKGSGAFSEVPKSDGCARGGNGISSITIDGNYAVILFKDDDFQGEAEVFTSSVKNLADHRLGSCCIITGRRDCANSAIIIPLKGTN